MRYGIPPYRLAREILDGEIARIVALGVQVFTDHAITTPEEMAQIRAQHDAVYLAPGAQRPRRLMQLPESAPWLMDSASFLARVNTGDVPALGRHIAVIGGGSAALDVARSARRAGHEVTIIALEAAARMPAQAEELVEAREEGITLVDSATLSAVQVQPGGELVLECQPVHFEPGPARGQFTITPLAMPPFPVTVDAVIPAVGQDPVATSPLQTQPSGPVVMWQAWRVSSPRRSAWANMRRTTSRAVWCPNPMRWRSSRKTTRRQLQR